MIRRVGKRGALLECAQPAAVAAVLRERIAAAGLQAAELVPGAATVLVLAPTRQGLPDLLALVDGLEEAVAAAPGDAAVEVTLPVSYDGPDLAVVAEATGLAVDEVVRLHAATVYTAAFTGFAPGFAYLTGLPEQLQLPRRAEPRTRVPAGSVAVADVYTAVYPRESPGGWNLLGTTDAVLFDPDRVPAALLAPGTRVRFAPR
ncbi:MAG: allophanate hydrolase [Mycobacterium sp.]|nr:allophanate hydrolase [Mycobacterium sp.]